MNKKHPYADWECWRPMQNLVFDEFKDIMRNGMIVISLNEMTTVFINLIVDFNRMQKMKLEQENKID